MVRPIAHRGNDDLGSVTDRTGRVHGRVVTGSSCGVRGRHSTSDVPCTPAPLGPGIYYDPGAPGSSIQPPIYHLGLILLSYHTVYTLPYPMTLMDLLSHYLNPHLHHMIHMHMLLLCLSICPVRVCHCMEVNISNHNEISGPGLQLSAAFFEQLVSGVLVDSFAITDYTVTDYDNPSYEPCLGRDSGTSAEGDRGRSEERDIVGSLHISDDDGDQDEPVPLALASSSGVRPGPEKGKGFTGSFMPVMSPWDPVLISSYRRHIAAFIWHGQRISIVDFPESTRLHATSSIYLEVHSLPIRVVASSPSSCGCS
ncbi:hypothetical protein M9H77_05162 [Catharanthus roseus]|uniref:Uncharacterized protein n=1 Tax=Catharanthus roseus TaxID=4058 RepID=A0ACC0CGB9_CATRO|nr:hypothetical protein M9H77_05162 [Catharanthus roseus]